MPDDVPLARPSDAFPTHVFDAFGVEPKVFEEKIGGSVLVVEKHPAEGPITLITAGVSRLAVDDGLPVELAVEVVDGQQGAALVALRIVCDDVATRRRTPPLGSPWRNPEPFLSGTAISAIVATASRWGTSFDDIRDGDGTIVGHVRTLRLLTDTEAALVGREGWEALVDRAGVDAVLDVLRGSTEAPPARPNLVMLSKLHDQLPPRWLSLSDGMFQSVTGTESAEYMDDPANHEIWSLSVYLHRFPWTQRFVDEAVEGQTARFESTDGTWALEE